MKISELIHELSQLQSSCGDIEVMLMGTSDEGISEPINQINLKPAVACRFNPKPNHVLLNAEAYVGSED